MDKETLLDKLILRFKNNRFFAIVLFLAVVIVGAAKLIDSLGSIVQQGKRLSRPPVETGASRPSATATPTPFADVTLSFGAKGIGPRMFTDPRGIALDGEEHIYVAEYQGGRVQLFDSKGAFLNQWHVRDKSQPIMGITAGREGTLFVVQNATVDRYEGATGQFLGQWQIPNQGFTLSDVKSIAGGGFVVALSGPDDLVVLDARGKPIQRIKAAISSQTNESAFLPHVAVDGSGDISVVDHYGSDVFKYSPQGRFLNRFGGEGLSPGQLHRVLSIAVDGKGRIYVSDQQGIQVFDSGGRSLHVIPVDGEVMGMVFNDSGDLFATVDDRVMKFTVRQ